ncbi:carbon storage regulator [Desulfosporosinus sp. PR]|uniref:carbon storage regulator n=1 Tax=Candidatus Desulfosporosinus nitrosoreducens TaxID=3401928 RepID=UPI0027F28390|nr:carbon storage regulator [Desulfosporosinus sp. PR]MDQ7092593.1 carbon storage regulator [Desulfosporosinus sp. PR]
MLVLGRKPGEYIMIGNDIMVKVIRSNTGDLRLAITAPQNTMITRGELYKSLNSSFPLKGQQRYNQ